MMLLNRIGLRDSFSKAFNILHIYLRTPHASTSSIGDDAHFIGLNTL